MSIRTRLMLTTSAIVLVIVSVLSIGIYSTFSRQLVQQVDQTLSNRVVMIADSLRRENSRQVFGRQRNPLNEALLPTRFDTVTQVVDTFGTVVIALGEVELPVTERTISIANSPSRGAFHDTITVDGDRYRMLTVPLVGGAHYRLQRTSTIYSVHKMPCAGGCWPLGQLALPLRHWLDGGLHNAPLALFNNLLQRHKTLLAHEIWQPPLPSAVIVK